MGKIKVGDRVRVPPSSWQPSTTGTVVEVSLFMATAPVFVKRDDSALTFGYSRDALRLLPEKTTSNQGDAS